MFRELLTGEQVFPREREASVGASLRGSALEECWSTAWVRAEEFCSQP